MPVSDAVLAFDAVAPIFDARFGPWRSVAAQRDAVRHVMARVFPPGARILELGGGTGEDALWLAQHGYAVHCTDAAPTMVAMAAQKLSGHASATTEVVAGERLPDWAIAHARQFQGAFSNFAALNCVPDLDPVARGMARALTPGASAVLVLFGLLPPGEVIVQLLQGVPRNTLRRLRNIEAPARLGAHRFTVRYHKPGDVARALQPWFRLEARRGIGIFVPPSAAEPWISEHPMLLNTLAACDRVAARPLALLGDHVLYHFVRNDRHAD